MVSSATYNLSRPNVVLMAITSQLRAAPGLGEVEVKQWREAGLIKPSVVKPVFATLEQALIIRRLGALGGGDRATLRTAIERVLGTDGGI